MFYREFEKISEITDEQKSLNFMRTYDIVNETEGTSCYYWFIEWYVVPFLSALGLTKDKHFPLRPNIGQNYANIIAFNEKVTPKNISRLDPQGKIFFWLANDNFNDYCNGIIPDASYLADLERFDEKSYQYLQQACITAYGKKGDPLIGYLIEETTRRTSLFMNNYQQVFIGDNYANVTSDMIIAQLENLTPLQFEWFCIKLVERSLENEGPETTISSQHTGKSGDGGIDGLIIQEFPNGERHHYYIQAKLYTQGNNIGNRDLRNFVGAYPPNKDFHHGIFITTTFFTKPANDYQENLNTHSLLLIDQVELISLMTGHEVGLKQVDAKPKLVMDNDFFNRLQRY